MLPSGPMTAMAIVSGCLDLDKLVSVIFVVCVIIYPFEIHIKCGSAAFELLDPAYCDDVQSTPSSKVKNKNPNLSFYREPVTGICFKIFTADFQHFQYH